MSFYTRLLRDQRVYQLGHTAQRILCDILMRGPIVLISRNGFLEAVLEYIHVSFPHDTQTGRNMSVL